MIMARQNDGTYTRIKSITSWIQNLEEDIPEIYFGNELVFREWEIYKGTLPVLLETTKERLYHYKIYGNDGGVGLKTEQLFSAANSEGGYLDTDGNVISPQHVNFRHTDFLALPLDANYIVVSYEGPSGTGMNAPALCFYDTDKTFLTGESYEGARTKTFTVPENARYFRTSYRSTMTSVNVAAGTVPAASDIPYGYKLPILSNDVTTDIYIGDTQLAKDEYVDSETGKIYRYVDGTLTPTEPPAPLPQIPTFASETTIDYGIAALPHVTGLDGIFEYGDIDGQTWKNSVSGENDITFDTAVTDTGAEYVLPAGASGQYTSKSGEYRTAFTWYCIAKCPTTYHTAGQYMISDLGNGVGVEISSGWAAYSSAGGNHLVRSVDNRDYNSQMPVTGYALIAVAGDVNGVASIYVNGVKMTDSWNFRPAPSDRAATVFLGKRASGQLSGTDIDYKFLAFGTVRQTDGDIAANSQYLMTKYLGVGRPEKVKFRYRVN